MEEPERRVTGARPASAARCPAVGMALPSPMKVRILVAVLTATPGIEIRMCTPSSCSFGSALS